MDDFNELNAEPLYTPLDVAVGLMARGFDLNARDGHPPLFDPYFND